MGCVGTMIVVVDVVVSGVVVVIAFERCILSVSCIKCDQGQNSRRG